VSKKIHPRENLRWEKGNFGEGWIYVQKIFRTELTCDIKGKDPATFSPYPYNTVRNRMISSSVLSTPKVMTNVPWASAYSSPMDNKTWDARRDPEAHSDRVDTAMSSSLRQRPTKS
jgi:hypothetical protein